MAANDLMAKSAAPSSVTQSFWLWVGAVAAGAVETVAVVGGGEAGSGRDVAVGVGVRCLAYALVLGLAFLMRGGTRWARIVLALGLGILGTLSLVMEPIEWLADDNNSIKTLFAEVDGWWWVAAAARGGHILAVWGAVALMFTTAANRYFRK
ncbi:hypothetical protein [Dactylosporangium sp. CA-139066]|uniref:hypothetical protein n=1 Tax=Dactylosporangium sp. CA-139066 TaxID=3239930 RepID=UPI003D8F278E